MIRAPQASRLAAGLALCLLARLALAHEEHLELAYKQVSLGDVCSNHQVPIISVPEALRLIGELKSSPSRCPDYYARSLYELEPVLRLGPRERLCDEAKFAQIRTYHFRYVNPLVESYKLGDDLDQLDEKIVKRPLSEAKVDYSVQLDDYKQTMLVPIAMQQFFKAWALQVSGVCKRTFVDNLDKALQLLTEADMELIEGENVSQLLAELGAPDESGRAAHFGELVYMPEHEGELEPGDLERRQSVVLLDLRSRPQALEFMRACQRRFRPIYSRLVLPIERLSKLGYEYVGPKLDDVREKLERNRDVRLWMALTRACESQGNFELVEPDSLAPLEELKYEPMYNYRIDGDLWIKGAEALARELDRLDGSRSTGFRRLLFNMGLAGRRLVARLDPHQFAWYRRNQNTLSSMLNLASIGSNTLSMASSG